MADVAGTLAADSDVAVVSVQMASPLEVALEIPAALWLPFGFGFLALAERIATMGVRIARKRKQELLKAAITDKQIQLVSEGRADVLALLVLNEGPRAGSSGPDEIVFSDPNDPDDEVEAA